MDRELEENIVEAREVLRNGGIVVYPTETAYGIAADALNPEAVEKVFEAKERPRDKGLTVIVDSLETAEKYAELTGAERKVVQELMPGPLTLVTEKKEEVPDILNEKFVFRISSGEVASQLAASGPITATSANISGGDTSYSVGDIDPALLEQVDYVLDTGALEPSPTSTIAEVNNGRVLIHRKGPVTRSEIEKVLNG